MEDQNTNRLASFTRKWCEWNLNPRFERQHLMESLTKVILVQVSALAHKI